MIGERTRYHSLLLAPARQRPKSAFRQLIIETVWKSYISRPRPKPRPFLPTIENDGPRQRGRTASAACRETNRFLGKDLMRLLALALTLSLADFAAVSAQTATHFALANDNKKSLMG